MAAPISELGEKVFPVTADAVDTLHPFPKVPETGVFSITELQKQLDGSEVYAAIEKMNHTA